jgi:hypothetical protein
MNTSGYIEQCGPWIPCLKAGEKQYTFTPEELSELMHRAFYDGYDFAKRIYYMPEVTTSTTKHDVVKEASHGTN